jgi:cyanate permease
MPAHCLITRRLARRARYITSSLSLFFKVLIIAVGTRVRKVYKARTLAALLVVNDVAVALDSKCLLE